jgi:hypothetical protein
VAWATAADVEEIVGREVESSVLAQADGHITIYANRTPDAVDGMSARDRYWLKVATCWQAAWLDQQVAVDGRSTATSLSTDGQSVTRDAEYQVVLGPLAARALRNLSWKASRSLDVRPVSAGPAWPRDFLSESSDELHGWEPLEGVG